MIFLFFVGGLFVCIVGLVRIYFIWVMVISLDGDIIWCLYDIRFLGVVEFFFGIVGDMKKFFFLCELIFNFLLIDLCFGCSY